MEITRQLIVPQKVTVQDFLKCQLTKYKKWGLCVGVLLENRQTFTHMD